MDNWSADKEFLQTFRAEAEERLRNLSEGVMTLEGNPGDDELLKRLFREAHTLKGSSGMMGFDPIKDLAHRLEDLFSSLQKGQIVPDKGVTDLMLETLDCIADLLPDQETGQMPDIDVSDLRERLVRANSGEEKAPGKEQIRAQPHPETESTRKAEPKVPAAEPSPAPQKPATAEVKDILPPRNKVTTAQANNADPTIRVNIERLDKLMNLMGEIVVNQINSEGQVREMASLQQEARDLHGIFSSLAGQVELLKEDSGADRIAALSQKLNEAESRAELVAGSFEAAVSHYKENTAVRRLALDELQERTLHVRMLPLSNIFGIYPRVVREASNAGGKLVRLEISGEDTELDKRILEQVADPIMHIVRNCVDHGIETPDKRRLAGKPEHGTIRLAAYQRGDRVEIEIEDDGAGIDPARVRETAISKKMIASDDELTSEETVDLLFQPGFSTAEKITEISGRGVGLDVVKNNIEKLEGYVTVDSTPGLGTRFIVSLPVTLAVIKGLLVQSNQIHFVIPLVSVREMVAIPADSIQTLGSHRGFIMRNSAIPVIDLLEYLGGDITSHGGNSQVVVVGNDKFSLGLEVGRLISEQEVVIKPMGSFLRKSVNVAGVTILGSGEAVVVLNINQLIRNVKEGRRTGGRSRRQEVSVADTVHRKKILIVEDSLVVRELQRNILETAGYEVDTAIDGEDALSHLAQDAVDCVVTDIEMPRMNGFDLTTAIRARGELKDTPVIMVTSCSNDDDKKRGIDVGANAYVIKGSFDQKNLLNTIERLVA